MPKMRLKSDRLQTSCLASGVAVHPKAEGSLVGRQCTRTQWIWVSSMVLPRTLEKLLNCSMPRFPTEVSAIRARRILKPFHPRFTQNRTLQFLTELVEVLQMASQPCPTPALHGKALPSQHLCLTSHGEH